MKTLLTLGGDTYLIPATTDIAKVLELTKGLRLVRKHETVYGFPEEKRYEESAGYRSAHVVEERTAELSVQLVHDDSLVERQEWNEMKDKQEARAKEAKENLPQAA